MYKSVTDVFTLVYDRSQPYQRRYRPKNVTHCKECQFFDDTKILYKLPEKVLIELEELQLDFSLRRPSGRVVYRMPYCHQSKHRGFFHELASKESNQDFLRSVYYFGCKEGIKKKSHRYSYGMWKKAHQTGFSFK